MRWMLDRQPDSDGGTQRFAEVHKAARVDIPAGEDVAPSSAGVERKPLFSR